MNTGTPGKADPQALRREYAREQAEIELVFADLTLKASKGEITVEEAQDRMDRWRRANSARLERQGRLAAELQRFSRPPGLPASGPRPLSPHFADPEKARRHGELEDMAAAAYAALAARSESPEHLQSLMDEWGRGGEGAAVLEEKQRLWAETAVERPLGTEPIVLEVPEDAGPEEVGTLDWRERSARRIMDIRAARPEATPEEMQDCMDERGEEFEEDQRQIARLMGAAQRRRLESRVARLRAVAETGVGAGAEIPEPHSMTAE